MKLAKDHPEWEMELCKSCYCMTYTIEDGTCGKCGASKGARMTK